MMNLNKNFNYIKENFIIYLKSLKEYKINLYLGFLMSIIYSSMFIIFLYVMYNNFNDFLNWGFNEYFFFVCISGFSATFYGTFFFAQRLNAFIKGGYLNDYLVKPINIYLQYFFNTSTLIFGTNSLIYLLALILFIIYNKFFYFDKFFYLIIFNLLSGIFFISINRLIESISFFLKEYLFLFNMYREFYVVFDRFPAHMFDGKIKMLTFFCANAYYGTYSTQFFFNNISNPFFLQLICQLLILIIICISLIYVLWKIGLKKYEAFG